MIIGKSKVNIIYSYNIPFNSKNYIIPNDSSDTVARQQYESLSGDTVNVYSLKDITLNIVWKKMCCYTIIHAI